jgi:multidrug efflux pump subunit AcrB
MREKLREYDVSVTEVVNALRAQNTTAPVGKVRGALEDQSIRLVGRIESPARIRADRGAAPRRCRWCAWARWPAVQDGFAEQNGYSLRNGNPNVGLSITRSRDASTVSVADAVRKLVVEESSRSCPPAPRWTSHAGRRRGSAEQPEQRGAGAGLRRRADGLRGLCSSTRGAPR